MFIMTSYFAIKYNSFDIVVNFTCNCYKFSYFLIPIIYIQRLNAKNIIPVYTILATFSH